MSQFQTETLPDWLEEHASPDLVIAGNYRVGDMVADLDCMLDGIWSDGIDALGEDA